MELNHWCSRVCRFILLPFDVCFQAMGNFSRSRNFEQLNPMQLESDEIKELDNLLSAIKADHDSISREMVGEGLEQFQLAQLESEPDQTKALLLKMKQTDNALIELNTLFESVQLESEPDDNKAFLLKMEQYHKSLIELRTRISSLKSENCDENAQAGWDEISDVNTKQLIRESGKSCETRIKNKDA